MIRMLRFDGEVVDLLVAIHTLKTPTIKQLCGVFPSKPRSTLRYYIRLFEEAGMVALSYYKHDCYVAITVIGEKAINTKDVDVLVLKRMPEKEA